MPQAAQSHVATGPTIDGANGVYHMEPSMSPQVSIDDLKLAVERDPTNREYANQLTSAFLRDRLINDMLDFWERIVSQHQHLEVPAEQFCTALESKRDFFRLLCFEQQSISTLPSSSFPKKEYLKSHDADNFLIQHIQRFSTRSSLVELVEDGPDEIWLKIFWTGSKLYEDYQLAKHLRERCVRRGQVTMFLEMWLKILRQDSPWMGLSELGFINLQLTWCCIEIEEDERAKNHLSQWLSSGPPTIEDSEFECMGKRLASKGNTKFLAHMYAKITYRSFRQRFLQGIMDGFIESGDIKGLTRVAMELLPFGQMESMMREVLLC